MICRNIELTWGLPDLKEGHAGDEDNRSYKMGINYYVHTRGPTASTLTLYTAV